MCFFTIPSSLTLMSYTTCLRRLALALALTISLSARAVESPSSAIYHLDTQGKQDALRGYLRKVFYPLPRWLQQLLLPRLARYVGLQGRRTFRVMKYPFNKHNRTRRYRFMGGGWDATKERFVALFLYADQETDYYVLQVAKRGKGGALRMAKQYRLLRNENYRLHSTHPIFITAYSGKCYRYCSVQERVRQVELPTNDPRKRLLALCSSGSPRCYLAVTVDPVRCTISDPRLRQEGVWKAYLKQCSFIFHFQRVRHATQEGVEIFVKEGKCSTVRFSVPEAAQSVYGENPHFTPYFDQHFYSKFTLSLLFKDVFVFFSLLLNTPYIVKLPEGELPLQLIKCALPSTDPIAYVSSSLAKEHGHLAMLKEHGYSNEGTSTYRFSYHQVTTEESGKLTQRCCRYTTSFPKPSPSWKEDSTQLMQHPDDPHTLFYFNAKRIFTYRFRDQECTQLWRSKPLGSNRVPLFYRLPHTTITGHNYLWVRSRKRDQAPWHAAVLALKATSGKGRIVQQQVEGASAHAITPAYMIVSQEDGYTVMAERTSVLLGICMVASLFGKL